MCGIAGVIGTYEQSSIQSMLRATKHRGPDNTGTYFDDYVALGVNRLSIVDLSSRANQPMSSIDGRYVIVYNGEVYNFIEIKEELKRNGIVFQSNSDTEVVLNAYIYYGKAMLDKIRGMFAFAIWDKFEKILFAARDHLGIKPFLFSYTDNRFIFCSELKGMLAGGYFNNSTLDVSAINTFITLGHVISPYTMVKGINSLKRGYYLEFHNYTYKVEQYWFPENISPLNPGEISYTECVNQLRDLVMSSVNEELMSDVPLGIFLSGGLDSNIISAALKLSGHNSIETYTVGFEKQYDLFDETSLAEKFAHFYSTKHTTLRIKEDEVGELFNDFITGLDQPSRDGLNTFLISKYVSRNLKVALSGLGGDELFIGYNGFFKFLSDDNTSGSGFFTKIFEVPMIRNIMPDNALRHAFSYSAKNNDALNYVYNLQKNIDLFGCRFMNKEWSLRNPYRLTSEVFQKNYRAGKGQINRIRMLYIDQYMGNLLLRDSDAVSMKHSLEVRFPILDRRIVEFALRMPADYLIKDLDTATDRNYEKSGLKRMLRDAFIKDLPKGFNRIKRGFQLPLVQWLKSSFKSYMEDSINNPSDIFNKKDLVRLYNNGDYPPHDFKTLWSILILDQWYKLVFRTNI